MWGKQFYHFDVARWLAGDPAARRRRPAAGTGATAHWWHMNSFDVISMPDPWEYPWYAAWDLAFHCVTHRPGRPRLRQAAAAAAAARVVPAPQRADPGVRVGVRRRQPAGARLGGAAGVRDSTAAATTSFLARVMHKLLLNFTWWVNRKDTGGNNVFEGGFLGLDNVGPFDRSAALPVAGVLEQSDGTGWMAMYALNLLEMALRAGRARPVL